MTRKFSNRNEMAEGAAPAVVRTLRRFHADHISHYLEGHGSSVLVPELAKRYRLPERQVMLMYGLEDFLRYLFTGLRKDRDVVLTSELHYSYYDHIADEKGIRLVAFHSNKGTESFSFDLEDFEDKVKKYKPTVVLIASPNNPTGNVLEPYEFALMAQTVSRNTLLLLDEAYIGFQRDYDEKFFLRMLRRYPNIGLLRTFSKDYGLAGIRLGYVLCGRRVRTILRDDNRDLGLSRIHEELGVAALRSEKFRRAAVVKIINLREQFIEQVRTTTSWKAYSSETNFVMLEAPSVSALRRLLRDAEGMSTVLTMHYGGRYVRVSIGRRNDLLLVVKKLQDSARKGSK